MADLVSELTYKHFSEEVFSTQNLYRYENSQTCTSFNSKTIWASELTLASFYLSRRAEQFDIYIDHKNQKMKKSNSVTLPIFADNSGSNQPRVSNLVSYERKFNLQQ